MAITTNNSTNVNARRERMMTLFSKAMFAKPQISAIRAWLAGRPFRQQAEGWRALTGGHKAVVATLYHQQGRL
jgi:hypothetical protein